MSSCLYEFELQCSFEKRSGWINRDGMRPYKIKFSDGTLVAWSDVVKDEKKRFQKMGLVATTKITKETPFTGDTDISEFESYKLRIFDSGVLPINLLYRVFDSRGIENSREGIYPTIQFYFDTESNSVKTKNI